MCTHRCLFVTQTCSPVHEGTRVRGLQHPWFHPYPPGALGVPDGLSSASVHFGPAACAKPGKAVKSLGPVLWHRSLSALPSLPGPDRVPRKPYWYVIAYFSPSAELQSSYNQKAIQSRWPGGGIKEWDKDGSSAPFLWRTNSLRAAGLPRGGQEDALREAKDLLREKTFQREETPCVGAAAGRAAQPARVPLGPRRLSGWKAPGTFFADI